MNRRTTLLAAGVILTGVMSSEASARSENCGVIAPCYPQCPANHTNETAKAWCRNTFAGCGEPTVAFWICVTGCGPADWEQISCSWVPE